MGSIEHTQFSVAAYNAHWGVGRFGPLRGRPFDVAATVASFDADIVVVPEAWRSDAGESALDPLARLGYAIESVELMRLEKRWPSGRGLVPRTGGWELAICSRFPVVARRLIPIGRIKADPAGARFALACTLDIDGRPIDIVGVHTSSKLWWLAPVRHMLALRRQLEAADSVPEIIAGDFNFWGPAVNAVFRHWRRAVRGPTYPANRPHSQIDHVLVGPGIEVVAASVLPATPSDHRPVRAVLRVPVSVGSVDMQTESVHEGPSR